MKIKLRWLILPAALLIASSSYATVINIKLEPYLKDMQVTQVYTSGPKTKKAYCKPGKCHVDFVKGVGKINYSIHNRMSPTQLQNIH